MGDFPDSSGLPSKLGVWLARLSGQVRSVSRFHPQIALEDLPLCIAEVRYQCAHDDELCAALDAVEGAAWELAKVTSRARSRDDDASIDAAREAVRLSLVGLKPVLATAKPSMMAQSLGSAWKPLVPPAIAAALLETNHSRQAALR